VCAVRNAEREVGGRGAGQSQAADFATSHQPPNTRLFIFLGCDFDKLLLCGTEYAWRRGLPVLVPWRSGEVRGG
jgi:hypothetical protein